MWMELWESGSEELGGCWRIEDLGRSSFISEQDCPAVLTELVAVVLDQFVRYNGNHYMSFVT